MSNSICLFFDLGCPSISKGLVPRIVARGFVLFLLMLMMEAKQRLIEDDLNTLRMQLLQLQ
ncbi:hypothetical protein GGTG_04348 [Gaeumannomyces tritici R3-111a-1]|uniref:Uncharacterized protein n=1 Tax=Gaeumannomyces tritici (strain R3-111a-1) TaxID=644352 RepID=J3NSU9_GAET3|nr:hypothetical protein GGTG_04348 [Gaeumannomyces tritici R3-111a-1]EJT79262.1 hypothetical protein GGTG_04348 [Gaeumannomyces tritici R3-111a-1]